MDEGVQFITLAKTNYRKDQFVLNAKEITNFGEGIAVFDGSDSTYDEMIASAIGWTCHDNVVLKGGEHHCNIGLRYGLNVLPTA